MARRESYLEAWCVKLARAKGIVVAKLTEVDGIPDRIFFFPGEPEIVEFKQPKKRGTGLQAKTQPWYRKQLTEAGYRVTYCETREQFLQLLKERLEKHVSGRSSTKLGTRRDGRVARGS